MTASSRPERAVRRAQWRDVRLLRRSHDSTLPHGDPSTALANARSGRDDTTLLLALAVLLGGCYTYVPVDVGNVRASEEVRVQVTPAAAVRIQPEFGAYATELEGQLGRPRPDSLSLSVQIGREYRGVALESGRQILFLGPSEVVSVRRRAFSRKKTVLVTAGSLVLFAVVVGTVTQWGDPNSTVIETPPPPPPSGRVIGVPH
jgi:hypothetical protein